MNGYEEISYAPAGDRGLMVQLGTRIDETTNDRVRCLMESLAGEREICEMIPSFAALLILYDSERISYTRLVCRVRKAVGRLTVTGTGKKRVFRIPVCYGGDYGPDLEAVACHAGLTPQEVIRLHSGRDYRIYMIGFLPGFAYLGGMDRRLFCPRLATPRTRIPAGSVGIGGEQTGMYPLSSPGGWRLIGRTPLKLYDAGRSPAVMYEMGDYIRFCPVTEKEYEEIAGCVQNGTFQWEMAE